MKIGIVTFFRVANYGAMLQAYALWQCLAQRGHDVTFLSTERSVAKNPTWFNVIKSRNFGNFKGKVQWKAQYPVTEFAKIFPQTQLCRTLDELRSAACGQDAIIVGSDQMWNPLWCAKGHLDYVMLNFAGDGTRRISYAVSFSVKDWPNDSTAEEAGRLLRKFASISVREKSGVALVKKLSGRDDAEWLLDPTMIHGADFYRSLLGVKERDRTGEAFLFKYLLPWSDGPAESIALDKVVSMIDGGVSVRDEKTLPHGGLGVLCRMLGVSSKIPVIDWICNISQARLVFTNSFHGTVFAILFHRPFISLLIRGRYSGMNERIVSLLDLVGLSSRAVYADDLGAIERAFTSPIDWTVVDSRIEQERARVASFFERSGL